jgi:NitT/TauT family transport system substrate-binding protein
MRTRRAIISGLMRASVVAAAAPVLAGPSSATSLKPLTIGIGGYTFAYLPLLTAKAAGFLEAEGYDVSLVNTGSGTNTLAAMLGGSVDVAGLVMSDVILAVAKGQKRRSMRSRRSCRNMQATP